MNKILSARFWIAIMAGIVFTYTSIKGMLSEAVMVGIIVKVYSDYFGRSDRRSK